MTCKKCGNTLNENETFCAKCGEKTTADDFTAKVQAITQTPDTTADFDPADIAQNKGLTILSYIGFLVLIPLIAAPHSRFARFHANQGLLLFICEVVFGVAYSIIIGVMGAISPLLSAVFGILGLLSFAFLVLAILGIVNVANGVAKELPLIGKIRLLS